VLDNQLDSKALALRVLSAITAKPSECNHHIVIESALEDNFE